MTLDIFALEKLVREQNTDTFKFLEEISDSQNESREYLVQTFLTNDTVNPWGGQARCQIGAAF